MNNGLYPLFFFLTFLTYAKEDYVFPLLIFIGCFIDFLCYPYQGIHTILLILFYVGNVSLKRCHTKKSAIGRTLINTFLYFFIIYVITRNASLLIFITQCLWNILFTIILFDKKRIETKRKNFS